MNTNDFDIKLNEFGMVDTAYYRKQGQLARNAFYAQQLSALSNWLKKMINKRQQTRFNSTRSFGTV